MPVIYDQCKIIPAPLVTIGEEILAGPDGRKVGTTYTITMNGTITTDMGSPQDGGLTGSSWGGPNNLFWIGSNYPPNDSTLVGSKQNSIQIKQNALRALFSTDGQWLEFQSPNGDAPLKCQPRLKSIQFADGIWVQSCPYTITLECDLLYLNGSPVVNTPTHSELISSTSENWQIQEADVKKTYSVTHTISAVGKRAFDSTGSESGYPWQRARDFVLNRLGVGYDGVGNFSTTSVDSLVNSSLLGSGTINFASLSPHNFSRNESIDQAGGSYSLTESWTLGAGSGTDVYTVNIKRIADEPLTTLSASIQGKITGYYENLFDYDTKLAGAEWMWENLRGQNLYNRVSSYATGIALNFQPSQASIDIDAINGTIDYNYTFDNKLYNGDVFETYVITKKNTPDDYKVSFTINGNIKGRKYDGDTDPHQPYLRAKAYFDTLDVIPVLYNRIVGPTYFPEASGLGLRVYPLNKNIDLNDAEGSINYTYEFNNRLNDGDISSDFIQEDYSITQNFSATEGKTNYSINGTIMGLGVYNFTRDQRYQNAVDYWTNTVEPQLYSRIQSYYGISIPNSSPISTEVERNKNSAQIRYNYTYNNQPAPLIAGALFENISVSEQNANRTVQVIAKQPILGRAAGPILQQINTTTERTRTLSIETIMAPTGAGDIAASFNLQPDYTTYVNAIAPNGGMIQEDTYTWIWREGRYSRNVTWIY